MAFMKATIIDLLIWGAVYSLGWSLLQERKPPLRAISVAKLALIYFGAGALLVANDLELLSTGARNATSLLWLDRFYLVVAAGLVHAAADYVRVHAPRPPQILTS